MKLVIREYLNLLKESGEFDVLMSDLLLAMNFIPISRPQVGVRQAGVDIAATGNDSDGNDCLYLFVLKIGDIGRTDWNGSVNAIRPSLDEIQDLYLLSHVSSTHAKLKKYIILCTTGDLKQESQTDWTTYTQRYKVSSSKEFLFWNGDKVATLVEEHLLNEYVLSKELRSDLRKALALVGEPEYDLGHFYKILSELLLNNSPKDGQKLTTANKRRLLKSFRTANIALNILFRWAESENNLHNAILAAERSVLWVGKLFA